MIKFLNKFKKPCFWPIFGPFSLFWGAKKILLENSALSCTTSYGFLAPCQNLEKTNDKIPRKHPDRWKDRQKDRRKDGQSLFHRTLPATARCPKRVKGMDIEQEIQKQQNGLSSNLFVDMI